mmetsp:Transcript_40019/g.96574  ORF Transcript_40019/g.96574 Transcript_40019/m.96574 type:complete len:330 (-) Transcript_40019:162-1151(-)
MSETSHPVIDTMAKAKDYIEEGKLEEARELLEKGLKILVNERGEGGDPSAEAIILARIGVVLKKQGKYKESVENYERLLELQMKTLGEDDPAVAMTLSHIGVGFFCQAKLKESMEKLERALEIQLDKLGENNLDTVNTYRHMGYVFREERKYENSETILRKCLEIQLQVLPHDHPDLALAYGDLASALQCQQKTAEAIKMRKNSLKSTLKHRGEWHPSLVMEYGNIGVLLKESGKLDQAEKMMNKALEIGKAVHETGGHEISIHTAATYRNIAIVYLDQGRLQDAIHANKEALLMHRRLLGDDHPRTQDTEKIHRHCLGILVEQRNRQN